MVGISSTKFELESNITREMLAAVLYRIAGLPVSDGIDGFSDTQNNTWYSNAVAWASDNNIICGNGNGIFGINKSVSQEQIATILWRYEGSPRNKNANQEFVDRDKISEYLKGAVGWVRANGIMNGITNNRFEPQAPVTREEIATIFIII